MQLVDQQFTNQVRLYGCAGFACTKFWHGFWAELARNWHGISDFWADQGRKRKIRAILSHKKNILFTFLGGKLEKFRLEFYFEQNLYLNISSWTEFSTLKFSWEGMVFTMGGILYLNIFLEQNFTYKMSKS